MEIHVLHGDTAYSFPTDVAFPLRLPWDDLHVVADAGGSFSPASDDSWVNLREGGIEFWLKLPWWMRVLGSTRSRSICSHARYLAAGDLHVKGRNLGALLQVLPAGKETSCHSHPPVDGNPEGTTEYFIPVLRHATPLLYLSSSDGCQIPEEGCCVEVGVPHQLQAPRCTPTLTLIFMWPIPCATWTGGHVPHDPPFVPYTSRDLPAWLQGIPIAGVGLIVTHDVEAGERNVLLLTELSGKEELHKRVGMQSFPMETRQSCEPCEQTLQRLLDQELPGLRSDVTISDEPAGVYQIVAGTWLLVWHAKSRSGLLPNGSHDSDIAGHRWVPLPDAIAMRDLRGGAFEPLCDLRDGRCRVVRAQCRTPSFDA